MTSLYWAPGALLNKFGKTSYRKVSQSHEIISIQRRFIQVWVLHYKDWTVVRPSYLYNGNSYTSKTASLYWDGSQVSCKSVRWYPTLQWRHDKRDGVSNYQPHKCSLNRLFRHRSKKTLKLRVTSPYEGNSPVTGELLSQRASNAENVSIWWRHRVIFQLA